MELVKLANLVVLVTPIDSAAPRQAHSAAAAGTAQRARQQGHRRNRTGKRTGGSTGTPCLPAQARRNRQSAFGAVSKIVPPTVPLTSFSILMARYKGTLSSAVEAVRVLDTLQDGDKVLISEGCTHHRQCQDIAQ